MLSKIIFILLLCNVRMSKSEENYFSSYSPTAVDTKVGFITTIGFYQFQIKAFPLTVETGEEIVRSLLPFYKQQLPALATNYDSIKVKVIRQSRRIYLVILLKFCRIT